jgi:hypothetical protein
MAPCFQNTGHTAFLPKKPATGDTDYGVPTR